MKHWNLLAEILGFASGCLLLWPAVVQNASLRRAWITAARFARSRTGLGRLMSAASSVVDAGRPHWSALDQWLLTLGAATLVLSFLVKVFVVWHTP